MIHDLRVIDVPFFFSVRSVHPELRIVGQMPMSVGAEQLLSQIVRHIPTRTWLWQYGRVPFHVLLAQWVHEVGSRLFVLRDI